MFDTSRPDLIDAKYLARQAAFDRLAVSQPDRLVRHVGVTAEKAVVFFA